MTGFTVKNGNPWWYEIASSPWDDDYYVSADAFYNNGATSGPIQGTPYVDPDVPRCSGVAAPIVAVAPETGAETTVFHGTGSAFTPNSTTNITVHQPDGNPYAGIYTRSTAVNSYGQFAWSWAWSQGDELGTYTFIAQDSGGVATQVSFAITADSTPPTPPAGSRLMFDIASA